jgi:hypothetical protein
VIALVCPVEPKHGRVMAVTGSRWGWYCPHADHDGRLPSHPLGAALGTRSHFTTAEVEAGCLLATPWSTPEQSAALLGAGVRKDPAQVSARRPRSHTVASPR